MKTELNELKLELADTLKAILTHPSLEASEIDFKSEYPPLSAAKGAQLLMIGWVAELVRRIKDLERKE